MSHFRRLPKGGRIDRGKRVSARFDGKPLAGFAGDTLASALLANDKLLVGRSFKYHRPRGLIAAGIEEPNGLFTIGEGATTEPNVAATVVELVDGLVASTQNAWPSADFDVMAVNSILAPMFQSGFYYKTFMGPRKGSWMFYEPFIRKAAGLGKATDQRDPDRYDMRYAFCDVLVIGSGPAGLAAALTAGRSGARVVLAEQDTEFGGSLLSGSDAEHEAWRVACVDELKSLPNVEAFTRTTVQGLYDGNLAVLVENRSHLRPDARKGQARMLLTQLRAKTIVMATGAIERPLVFSNNDRPGVMLASALRSYANRFAVAPEKRAVIVANNDFGLCHGAGPRRRRRCRHRGGSSCRRLRRYPCARRCQGHRHLPRQRHRRCRGQQGGQGREARRRACRHRRMRRGRHGGRLVARGASLLAWRHQAEV